MDYAKHYAALIARGRRRNLRYCYYETHHIVPRCIGGGDEPSNLVKLTPEEHYVAHQLLVKMYPKKGKLLYAVRAMTMEAPTHGGGRSKNKLYGWIQRRYVEMKRQERRAASAKRWRFKPSDVARLAAALAPIERIS